MNRAIKAIREVGKLDRMAALNADDIEPMVQALSLETASMQHRLKESCDPDFRLGTAGEE